MKRAIITGMNGTVAPVVAALFQSRDIEVIPWDRSAVSPEDPERVESFILNERPDAVLHFAMGSPAWAAKMAQISMRENIRFLYASSVSVFSPSSYGPFTVDIAPDATDEYGAYKITCEQCVRRANPRSIRARLGWQIGHEVGSNNMVDCLDKTMKEKGVVDASSKWIVSCSFLDDTATAIHELVTRWDGGTYQLEGNPGLSFFEIATHLNKLHGGHWVINETDTPNWDNRMIDDRLLLRHITHRL